MLYAVAMALIIPVALCLVAIVVSALPPADVRPAEGPSNWLSMAVATLAVVGVIAFAVHQLRENDPRAPAHQLAGNP